MFLGIAFYGSKRNTRDDDTVDYLIITKYLLQDELVEFVNFKKLYQSNPPDPPRGFLRPRARRASDFCVRIKNKGVVAL